MLKKNMTNILLSTYTPNRYLNLPAISVTYVRLFSSHTANCSAAVLSKYHLLRQDHGIEVVQFHDSAFRETTPVHRHFQCTVKQ